MGIVVERWNMHKRIAVTMVLSAGTNIPVDLQVFRDVKLVVIVICFLTEVISNMASVLIFGPILMEVAASLCVLPLKMLLVVCFASSFAFMMPMAGGPNMLAYGTGQDFSLRFMIRHGFALNCIACIIGVLYLNYIMPTILDPNQYGVPKKLINKTSGCGW
eukprot:g374.t1